MSQGGEKKIMKEKCTAEKNIYRGRERERWEGEREMRERDIKGGEYILSRLIMLRIFNSRVHS